MTKNIFLFSLSVLVLSACTTDKKAHFVAGAAVSGVVADYTGSHVKGCAASFGVGFLKEYVVDKSVHGKPDIKDALATGAGCTFWSITW